MNDTELDEMLDRWSAPAAPASLRARLRGSFAGNNRARGFLGWMSGFAPRVLVSAAVGLGAIALIVTSAMPQTPNLTGVPYVVESELIEYSRDGSQSTAHLDSYNSGGREIALSMYMPNSPFSSMFMRAVKNFHAALAPLHEHLTPQQSAQREGAAVVYLGCADSNCIVTSPYWFAQAAELLQSKCEVEGPMIGRENILGYATVAVRVTTGPNKTVTMWRAPALGCFALRVKKEQWDAAGKARLLSAKLPVRITVTVR